MKERTRVIPQARMLAPDDQHWLSAARRGEAWALERFYEAHQACIYALCYRILGRPDDAEDAMQAAFVQAFRALPGFRGDSSAKTWLYRIAVNQSLSILRKRGDAVPVLEEDVPVSDGAPMVAEKLAIQAALDRLNPKHRTVLALRFWEDLSYEEIAFVLGVPMPTVKMRLKRAKDEFRRHYEEHP